MKILWTMCLALFILASCEKADPIIPNEEEVISTLIYTLTPLDGGVPSVLKFRDLDGDGGNPPEMEVDPIVVNKTYQGQLLLQHEQNFLIADLNQEILEEAEDHQFFFSTTLAGLEVNYADVDSNGNPVGLTTTVTSTKTGVGLLTITLRHEPDKMALGVREGDIKNAGGETDIEITFDIDVK